MSGGDITFKLTKMPCGTSSLGIRVIPNKHNKEFKWHTLNNNDLNNENEIGTKANVLDYTITTFRLQAQSQDFNKISCPTPSFSGLICYSQQKHSHRKCGVTCMSIIGGVFGSIAGGIITIMILSRCCRSSVPRNIEPIKVYDTVT
ncbi:6036_t:CDS:2 [Funneliformis mosseae]|uniref:6036_t:CDS:1 n=1 Tax=Funneliformis mosseae TaxID=27381 RepID=A0A9N9ABL7_FUNMO|nr:6036_t:CDS:2 [Funneliformis mosseae]